MIILIRLYATAWRNNISEYRVTKNVSEKDIEVVLESFPVFLEWRYGQKSVKSHRKMFILTPKTAVSYNIENGR